MTEPLMPLKAFLIQYFSTPVDPPYRRGQFLYNELKRVNPDLATKILGTRFDPFYDDERIYDALAHIILWWD